MVLAAGCAGTAATNSFEHPLASQRAVYLPQAASLQQILTSPELVASAANTGKLEDWPIDPSGGHDPAALSNPLGVSGQYSLAADGNVVAIPNGNSILLYDVATQSKTTLSDPDGTAIDVAFDKHATLYVLNVDGSAPSNVAMYSAFSTQPQELTCQYIDFGQNIAVDDEGDVFVNGYEKHTPTGVVEFPSGPNGPQSGNCTRLILKYEGSPAGLAVDPTTDALITLDNPDQCAGGAEGLMTIYPKPYQKSTATAHVLGGNCTGGLRLDASATTIFYGDEDVSGSFSYIQQRTYPGGAHLGTYWGGDAGGFTTIPNRLPN
jgi:hypothetical protein